MKKAIPFISIFSLALLFATAVKSQEKEEEIEFTTYLWEGPLTEQLYYRKGEAYIPIQPTTSSRSEVLTLASGQNFTLHVKLDLGEEEEPVFPIVGRAPALPNSKKLLFLLFKQEMENGDQFRVLPFDDSIIGFPAGSFRFVNFSKADLLIKFAEQSKKIPNQQMTIMESKVTAGGGLVPFVIGNEKGDKIFETRLFAQATGREIVFISPPTKSKILPSVRFLPQLLPQKLPEPPNE